MSEASSALREFTRCGARHYAAFCSEVRAVLRVLLLGIRGESAFRGFLRCRGTKLFFEVMKYWRI